MSHQVYVLRNRQRIAIWGDANTRGPLAFKSAEDASHYADMLGDATKGFTPAPMHMDALRDTARLKGWTDLWAVKWRENGTATYRGLPLSIAKKR